MIIRYDVIPICFDVFLMFTPNDPPNGKEKKQYNVATIGRHLSNGESYININQVASKQGMLPCFGLSHGQADIVKQIWAELPKHMSTPVAPLDEEMLSELAKVPAVVEGPFGIFWHVVDSFYGFSGCG